MKIFLTDEAFNERINREIVKTKQEDYRERQLHELQERLWKLEELYTQLELRLNDLEDGR